MVVVKHKWYYFAKLCYGLPHCGCKLCYRPPLKRLSEVNFISFPDIENEDTETAHEIDNISYKEKEIRFKSYWLVKETFEKNCILLFSDFCVNCKVFRAVAVSHRHPSKDTQGHVNYFSWKKTSTQSVSSHMHLNYDMTDLVGHQAIITFDTVKSRWRNMFGSVRSSRSHNV